MAQLYQHRLPNYVFTEKLGQGTYASVFKAYHQKGPRQVVAIKCIQKTSLTKSATENLLTEIEILKKIKHVHIVELKDFQWDNHFIYLIMEYCAGGDLSRFIKMHKKIPEATVRRFLQQLAKALQVLHLNNISHMDLKPQNILLSSLRNPVLKIADFGFAQYLGDSETATSLRGSPLYMAPEMLLSHHYDNKVDLWSVGIIMHECLFGRAPFSSPTFEGLAEKIKSSEPVKVPFGADISESSRDLILKLLQRDPAKRISFEDFFHHPFIDLEHIPSQESFHKGVQLVEKAVKFDSDGKLKDALQQYCQALQYLVPVLQNENDTSKWKGLKARVTEYVERAEQIKQQLKSSQPVQNSEAEDKNDLDTLCKKDPSLKTAVILAESAKRLAVCDRLQEALSTYQEALDILIPKVNKASPLEKDILYNEAQKWLDAAEVIKSYIAVQRFDVESKRSWQSEAADQSCVIQ